MDSFVRISRDSIYDAAVIAKNAQTYLQENPGDPAGGADAEYRYDLFLETAVDWINSLANDDAIMQQTASQAGIGSSDDARRYVMGLVSALRASDGFNTY